MARRDKYEAQHARNRLEYERHVRRIFEETCRECGVSVTKIEALVKSAGEGAVLAEIPTVRRILDKLQRKLKDRLETAVINGIRAEWRLANEKYDALIGTMAAGDLLEKMDEEAKARTMARNLEALEAFIKRKEAGLGLSHRVWHYTGQMREAMEVALELGIGEGQSAAEIARELKQYLVYPDKLFRRVRDKETGELKLSRPASLFHPGQGVYRSSYKNALRLALNETNIAYRKADTMRRKNLYFVVGIEVHLSNNHNCKGVPEGQFYDICDILQGKYPADFEFVGWHPNCRCWTSSILQTDEEFIRDSDGVYRGSVNEVKDVPPQFKQWVKDNADRIKSAESRGSLPYFLRDNEWAWRGELEDQEPELTIQQRADIRHSQRTQAEIDAIKEAWNKRREDRSQLNLICELLRDTGLEYHDVKALEKSLTSKEIIERLGGGDQTIGSCSSLAFAYAANRSGLDVLDYRGGDSRTFFARNSSIRSIITKVGGDIVEHTNDYTAAGQLLKKVAVGHEYYFACGKHAAIVRKSDDGGFFMYLELQSKTQSENGYQVLTTGDLKRRFGAQKSYTLGGQKRTNTSALIDIEKLGADPGFRRLMGYINTPADKQKKGKDGSIK